MISLDIIGSQPDGWWVNVTPDAMAANPALSSYVSAARPLRVVWAGDNSATPVSTVALKFTNEAQARGALSAWWPRDPSDTSSPPTVLGAATPALTASGPVTSTADDQVIEGLDITAADGVNAVTVTHANVTVQRCRVSHENADGIQATGSGVTIRDVIVNCRAPASGPLAVYGSNITVSGGGSPLIERVRLARGSTGIYCVNSPGAVLRWVQGSDFRGPGPRGQLVQFDKCSGAILEDFSCDAADATSWPEDIVSVYQSSNVRVRRGVVDGNNSQTGVGIMFEGSNGGSCEEVDAVRQLNGSFFSSSSADVVFRDCRARDQRNSDCGRGLPSSNSLTFGAINGSANIVYQNCAYFNQANPGNIGLGFDDATSSIRIQNFPARAALNLTWAWE